MTVHAPAPDTVARGFDPRKYILTMQRRAAAGAGCPDCGGPLVRGEGCTMCPVCGFSNCA